MSRSTPASPSFDPACADCPRLAGFLRDVQARHPCYHCAPVAPFGSRSARLLVVGLAPGMHGANRTGRPFTGDYAGVLLYETLHRHHFASQPKGEDPADGLQLLDCRISNAVKCLPPDNKPSPLEIQTCNRYLAAELAQPDGPRVLLTLGKIAHDAVLRALDLRTLGLRASAFPFGHGREFALPDGRVVLASYHCSRYNTNTRRLTPEMFDAVVARARALVEVA